jgi:HAD superfamily hydrolase (TIGR01490 family)
MKKKIKKRPVAVFDVDGTIFRSSLLIELVEAMIERKLFPETVWEEYQKERRLWRDREGEYPDYINAVVRSFKLHLKGVSYTDFVDVAERVIDEQSKHVYRFTRDLIADLKKQGYFLLAVSQSPKTVLDKFAEKIGFDKAYGSLYELGPSDMFTGKMIDEHLIMNKANILRRAVEKENLTLKNSVGVGDTESDVAFLELVKKPICFNPNAALYRHATRMKWKVVVERKDVIYQIKK